VGSEFRHGPPNACSHFGYKLWCHVTQIIIMLHIIYCGMNLWQGLVIAYIASCGLRPQKDSTAKAVCITAVLASITNSLVNFLADWLQGVNIKAMLETLFRGQIYMFLSELCAEQTHRVYIPFAAAPFPSAQIIFFCKNNWKHTQKY
jgi:hypothetical protein